SRSRRTINTLAAPFGARFVELINRDSESPNVHHACAAAASRQRIAQRIDAMILCVGVDVVRVRAAVRQRGQRPNEICARAKDFQSGLTVAANRESRVNRRRASDARAGAFFGWFPAAAHAVHLLRTATSSNVNERG